MKFFWQQPNSPVGGDQEKEALLNAAQIQSSDRDESEADNDNDNDNHDDDDVNQDEWEGRVIRHLMWDDSNHFAVLTQVYGSVWPRVLPFCLVNVIWTYIVFYLNEYGGLDLTVNPTGHQYMAPLMSFLVVTRLKITFDNYMSQSKNLQAIYKSCRDLVATVCLLTSNDTSKRAKQWRQDVAYGVLILLRVTIGVLDFRSSKEDPWLLPEMAQENSDELLKYSLKDHHHHQPSRRSQISTGGLEYRRASTNSFTSSMGSHDEDFLEMPMKQRLSHIADSERKVLEEASRAVYVLAWNVRREIMKQRDGTWIRSDIWQHPCNEETKLLDFIADFLQAFHGCYKLITTPMPMPLVQMNKVILFLWLYSLPLTLCHVKLNQIADSPFVSMILVFILTFGFMGLEFVSMELSDPFGEDPSDFDDLGHGQMAMEDCYISIYRLDGKSWAKALRKRLKTKAKTETPQPSPPPDSNAFSF